MFSLRLAAAQAAAFCLVLASSQWAATPQKVEARFVKHSVTMVAACGTDASESKWDDTTALLSVPPVSKDCAGGMAALTSLTFSQVSPAVEANYAGVNADLTFDAPLVTLASIDGSVSNKTSNDSFAVVAIQVPLTDNPPDGGGAARGNCPDQVQMRLALPALGSTPVRLQQTLCERSRTQSWSILDGSGVIWVILDTWFTLGSKVAGSASIRVEVRSYYKLVSKFDLSVDRIEVVQAVQTPDNEIPLVAGKKTVARVFAKIGAGLVPPVAGVTAYLRASRNGERLYESLRANNGAIVGYNLANREETNHALNFELPAAWTTEGNLTLEASLNEGGVLYEDQRDNNKGSTQVYFGAAPELSVAYIRVCVPGPPTCPSAVIGNATMRQFVERLYPVAAGKFKYKSLGVTWNWPGPMTAAREGDFLAALQRRFEFMDSVDGTGADQLVAWLPQAGASNLGVSAPVWAGSTKTGRVAFCTDTSRQALARWPGGNAAVTLVDPLDPVFTLAHELGHNFGLRHPDRADGCGAADASTDWPHASAKLDEVGFDPVAMKAKPKSKFDLMSYCSPPADNIWISRFSYEKLFRGKFLPAAVKPAPGRRLASPSESVILSGWAAQDGSSGQLDPAYRLRSQTPAQLSNSSGNHCLRFFDPAGPIAEHCFQLDFTHHRTGEPLERASFALKAAWPDGTVRVSLMRGENVLATLSGGAAPPTLSILSPQPGDKWSSRNTITWSGSDPGGLPLSYTVLYSPDGGGRWMPLHSDTTDTQLPVDTAELEATAQVLIRVLASNGLSSATATAGPIEVLAVPRMEAGPASLDFGPVAVADASVLKVLVENRGNAALTLSSAGSDQPAFTVTGAPVEVPPREVRELLVRFTPKAPGEVRGTLTLTGDDSENSTATVGLLGVGATPRIAASADRLDFGAVAAGSHKTLKLSLSSTGDGPLVIKALTTGDPQFTVASPELPFSIDAGAEQEIAISFAPSSSAALQSTLSITSTDGSKPTLSVALVSLGVGTPAAAPAIAVSPGALDFGSVEVNRSKDLSATVANAGSVALDVTTLGIDNASFTVVSPAAPFSVDAGASKTVTVRFAPTSAGAQSGTLGITSNDSANPNVPLALSGAGSAPQQGAPAIGLSPASLDFGDVERGQSKDLALDVSNSGGGALNVTGLTIDNARFAVVSTTLPFSVAAGAKQALTVRFSPAAEGQQSGLLVVANNDANRPSAFVPLSGTGTAAMTGGTPRIQVSATAIDFGTIRSGATSDKTLVVQNAGGGTLAVSGLTVSGGPFTVLSPAVPFSLAGGAQQAVSVRFAPGAAGAFAGILTILSNDAAKASVTLALSTLR